ncbi:MAG: hypothetical protein COA43_04370 [Robiginitomaculum sp.]|nr:MAG: hypothetical protein COA43_04370 [Robiginitomaculum sp.]
MENFVEYTLTIKTIAAVGGLLLVQLIIADIAGIKSKHNPGSTVTADHNSFLFRATRVLGNMNESVMIFMAFAIAGILSGADPVLLGRSAMVYALARACFALCYWFNIKTARSIFFGVGAIALFVMGVAVIMSLT